MMLPAPDLNYSSERSRAPQSAIRRAEMGSRLIPDAGQGVSGWPKARADMMSPLAICQRMIQDIQAGADSRALLLEAGWPAAILAAHHQTCMAVIAASVEGEP